MRCGAERTVINTFLRCLGFLETLLMLACHFEAGLPFSGHRQPGGGQHALPCKSALSGGSQRERRVARAGLDARRPAACCHRPTNGLAGSGCLEMASSSVCWARVPGVFADGALERG